MHIFSVTRKHSLMFKEHDIFVFLPIVIVFSACLFKPPPSE